MSGQNNDPRLTNLILHADIEQVNHLLMLRLLAEQCKQSHCISDLEARHSDSEARHKEILQRVEKLEEFYGLISYFRHLAARNEELQDVVDSFCPPD
ncbi:MAG: hypothetical protein KME29_29335 [Calothrix sp. FI2-JRJ7]|jgi:hypothetical protein|nr:hypothetical protein [Calothrix sp. FI2-JRJ7]